MSDDDPYRIPGSDVLRNKLGITDSATLDRAERLWAAQRMSEGAPTGHAKAIHHHLFQDGYGWAGQVCTLEIAKDGSQFQFRQYIETGMADGYRCTSSNISANWRIRQAISCDFFRLSGRQGAWRRPSSKHRAS